MSRLAACDAQAEGSEGCVALGLGKRSMRSEKLALGGDYIEERDHALGEQAACAEEGSRAQVYQRADIPDQGVTSSLKLALRGCEIERELPLCEGKVGTRGVCLGGGSSARARVVIEEGQGDAEGDEAADPGLGEASTPDELEIGQREGATRFEALLLGGALELGTGCPQIGTGCASALQRDRGAGEIWRPFNGRGRLGIFVAQADAEWRLGAKEYREGEQVEVASARGLLRHAAGVNLFGLGAADVVGTYVSVMHAASSLGHELSSYGD